VTMRAADVPEAAMRALRQQRAERSRLRLQDFIDAVGASATPAVPGVAFGEAARVVIARAHAMRADAVVIGKRRRGLLADFLLGSVTQRVLAEVQTDVLVLHRRRAAIVAHAPRAGPLHRVVP